MSNSDYIIKAAIKKVTEKLNEVLVEKIEEATNIAQDAPEIFKKEFENLKDSIIEEAEKMQNEVNTYNKSNVATQQNSIINRTSEKIQDINKQIEKLNKKINYKI